MAAMGTSRSPIVISDDDDEPVAAREQRRPAERSGGNDDEATRRPDWLPHDFIVGVERRCPDGTVILNYTCPADFTFNSRPQVEVYCSSGAFQRAMAAKSTLDDMTTLQGKYKWLMAYPGFVLEIRAGGENLSKMFKYYAHTPMRVRIAPKEDFMRYVRDGEIPEHTNEECDTRGEDNIIAQIEFLIDGLPPGWVKETTFRKCKKGIRKDRFYTDPVSKSVYRSLKAAVKSFKSGIDADFHNPNLSVTDMYFFDNSADMLPCLADRLKIEETENQQCTEVGQNSHSKKRGVSAGLDQSQGKGNKPITKKKRDKDAWSTDASKPSRPRGRPRKSHAFPQSSHLLFGDCPSS